MEYTQLSLTLEEYQQSKEEIKKELSGIAKSFIRTGWYLDRIDRSGAYKMDGYKSVAEFAKTEYNMTPSGVSRFIKVYNRYTIPGDTPELLPQYEGFNFSQLQEMLQIPEMDHDMILPEAKKENIRELRRFNTENENNPDNLLDWKEEKESELNIAVIEFYRANKELTNELFSSKYWHDQNIKELADIINPSGNRSYHKGKIFLMMYEQNLMINEFGKGKTTMSWEEFFQLTKGIFGEAIDGAKTYQNYFGGTEDGQRRDNKTTEAGSTGESEGRTGITEQASSRMGEIPAGNVRSGENRTRREERTADSKGTAAGKEPEPKPKRRENEPKPETKAEKTETPMNLPLPEIAPAQEMEKIDEDDVVYMGKCSLADIVRGMPAPTKEEIDAAKAEYGKMEVQEHDEIISFGSRWDYLKSQGKFAVALQLAVIAQEAQHSSLKKADFWDCWLGQEVDENGEALEEVSEELNEQIAGQLSIDDIEIQEGAENEPTAEEET